MTTLPAWLTAPLARRRAHREYQPRHRTGTIAPVPAGWTPLAESTRAALREGTREHQLVQPAGQATR